MKNNFFRFSVTLGCIFLVPVFNSMAQEGGCVGLVSKKCHTARTLSYPDEDLVVVESDGFIQTCGSGSDSLQCIDAGTASCTWDSWVVSDIGDPDKIHHTDPAVPVTAPDPSYPCNIAGNFDSKEWLLADFV
jgi:hypothetical protein